MGRGPLYTFPKRTHTDGQQTCEKVLNITHHQKKMQIETTMSYHFKPASMAITKESANTK